VKSAGDLSLRRMPDGLMGNLAVMVQNQVKCVASACAALNIVK
jgi:hypothetical protein